ncbi:hypothetical protein BDW71DRAFT_191374 [Aspergillus fruticulosus]
MAIYSDCRRGRSCSFRSPRGYRGLRNRDWPNYRVDHLIFCWEAQCNLEWRPGAPAPQRSPWGQSREYNAPPGQTWVPAPVAAYLACLGCRLH